MNEPVNGAQVWKWLLLLASITCPFVYKCIGRKSMESQVQVVKIEFWEDRSQTRFHDLSICLYPAFETERRKKKKCLS